MMQVSIIAPAVFKTIDIQEAGPFLRNVFPKLFLVVLILSLTSLLYLYFFGTKDGVPLAVSFATAIAMTICYIIVPATNAAKDSGNEDQFKRLHTVSVLLTLTVLIINLGWSFF